MSEGMFSLMRHQSQESGEMQCSVPEENVLKFDTKSAEYRQKFCRSGNNSSLLFPSEWLLSQAMCMTEPQRYR